MFLSSRNIKEEVRALIASQLQALDSERVDAALETVQAGQKKQEYIDAAIVPKIKAILEANDFGIAINSANIGAISDWVFKNRRSQVTRETVADAVRNCTLAPKPPLSEEEQRQVLEADLKAEGASSTLIAKFPGMTLAELQTKLEELRNVKRWKAMDHRQLKAEVRAQVQSYTFEPLPDNLTAFNISQMSAAQWTTVLRKYGKTQLDARIAEQQAAGDWKHTPIVTETR